MSSTGATTAAENGGAGGDEGPRRILVTGASGMVGHAVQKVSKEEGVARPTDTYIFVSTKDADLTDEVATEKLFKKHKPTHVINLAAMTGGLGKQMKYPLDFFRVNMLINDNVLYWSDKCGVTKVVSMLSTCIFPDKITYPILETQLHDGPPHNSNFGYSYAKRMIDVLNRGYRRQLGRHYISVSPTNVFGPHDNFNLEDSHVFAALCRKSVECKEAGDPLKVWGTGSPRRQFIFSEDLAKLIIWALFDYDEEETIFLSGGEESEISIAELAETVRKVTKIPQPLEFDTSKPDGQHKKTVSNAKLMKYRPDFKFTPIEEAVKYSVQWYIDNKASARH